MRLTTFGGLTLEGSEFRRAKPLLLLAYLALEGARERRHLAELFWPDASDGLNSLSRALSQLRKGAPGALEADAQRVWATVPCDAHEFLAAVEAKDDARTVGLHQAPFLDGVHLPDWSSELEEWVYATRERLAARAQEAQLRLAEAAAAAGRFDEAGRLAEAAYQLPGAPLPEPEELLRYYTLLVAGERPLASEVRREAEGFGIRLTVDADESRARLRSAFLGRARERERLAALQPGQWAWLQGGPGMGKTALLRSLDGTYLAGRAGLPYATLEPLLGRQQLDEGPELLLRRLAGARGSWLIDNWEWIDPESQALLRRLRDLRPELRVVISSRQPPAMRVDLELELGPLQPAELDEHPGLYQATGGIPALVGAALRGEPLEAALETRLHALPDSAADTYLALVLLADPQPPLVRRALGLSAGEMAEALERLITVGLIDPSGRPRAAAAAGEFLEAEPVRAAQLALRLARELEPLAAYPLFERARALWEESDLPAVERAYAAWAGELLARGFPQRATDVLGQGPTSEALTLLRARALERAGHYREALEALAGQPETPELLALQGALYWRLGQPDAARASAERALEGDSAARAGAFNTLGHLARSEGDLAAAARYARRAAALWRSLGEQARWVDALNSLAVARSLQGEDSTEAFQEALAAAGDNPLLEGRVRLNLGWQYDRSGHPEQARDAYRQAAELAEAAGALETSAWAWNNLGVLHHRHGEHAQAEASYLRALELAQRAGEQRILGMVMANLAELGGDAEAWQEALDLLERAGHGEEAERYRDDLPDNHPFRQLAESKQR